ncbi:MAG: tetratricopeptide repeat protein [Acidobacteriota bacterium]
MKILRWLAALAVLTAMLTVIVWLTFTRWRAEEPEWTSRSGEALDELQLGIEDFSRRYWTDAFQHFERAVELDPEQAGSLLHLYWMSDGHDDEAAASLMQRLLELDDARLNAREQFLVAYHHARSEGDEATAAERLATFRLEHPDDFYGLLTECNVVYRNEQWRAAEACYRRVLETFPNWGEAYDVLGFIAMAQGRFDEAEESFRAYRFVAPDMATPYSSLGQLQILLGAYDEAQKTLLQALRIKSDYCEAMIHLARLYTLSDAAGDALEVVDRLDAEPACSWYQEMGIVCSTRAMVMHWSGRDERAQEILDGGCFERREGFDLTAHRLAVLGGDLERAFAIEDIVRQRAAATGESENDSLDENGALLAHLQGVRQLATDDLPAAIESFRLADDRLGYWNLRLGTLKTFNRLHLAEALARAGRTAEARAVYRQIEAVNPRFARDAHLPGFETHLGRL